MMKKILLLLLLISSFCSGQVLKRVPLTTLYPSYTSIQEDSIALTLSSAIKYYSIWNTTLVTIRIWDGSVFQTVPAIPFTMLPVAVNSEYGTATPFVILSGSTLTNGVAGQLVTGNTGHVGTETNPFTYVSGTDISGDVLGNSSTINTPLGDAYLEHQKHLLLTPTFSYSAGLVDLATDIHTPDGIGVFKTGVYKITGACNIGASGITISGLGDVIFNISGAFNTTTLSSVRLINGATSGNICFCSNGAVTLGAATTMAGTIQSGFAAITTGAGVALDGRLISQTAITLGGGINVFTIPSG